MQKIYHTLARSRVVAQFDKEASRARDFYGAAFLYSKASRQFARLALILRVAKTACSG
jgi:hypothetical protein